MLLCNKELLMTWRNVYNNIKQKKKLNIKFIYRVRAQLCKEKRYS